MNIKSITVQPHDKSVMPAICFKIEISYGQYREAITNVDGWLESDDGHLLARLAENVENSTESIAARNSSFDHNFTEKQCNIALTAFLEKQVIKHIENRRLCNQKRDVYFNLNITLTTVQSNATISHIHQLEQTVYPKVRTNSGNVTDGKTLFYGYDHDYSSQYTNFWILSGNGNPTYLSINRQTVKKEAIRINSTDWIHDYAPKFGLGEYFIVEIPKGNEIVGRAWNYVKEAEDCYRQWNIKGVYANCREVRTILNSEVGKKFDNTPTIKKWNRAISMFEQLSSLALHEEDVKEQKPIGEVAIGKPEAEYALIVTKALIKYAEELLCEKEST